MHFKRQKTLAQEIEGLAIDILLTRLWCIVPKSWLKDLRGEDGRHDKRDPVQAMVARMGQF